jgi:hypothetical protein
MTKINHNKLKTALAKYSEAYKESPEGIEELILADGYSEDEVTQIIEALDPTEKAETKVKAKVNATVTSTPVYEKWSVKVVYQYKEIRGQRIPIEDELGYHLFDLEKRDYIRDCKISEDQAEILNQQSINSKEHYYKK